MGNTETIVRIKDPIRCQRYGQGYLGLLFEVDGTTYEFLTRPASLRNLADNADGLGWDRARLHPQDPGSNKPTSPPTPQEPF